MRKLLSTCVVLLLSQLPAIAGGTWPQPYHHLRTLDRDAARLLGSAVSQSPTVRRLVQEVEGSDLIVYLRMSPGVARYTASTRLIGASAMARIVLVSINPFAFDWELCPLLGHELEHVTEIARAADVRDADGMRRLYQQIGWNSSGVDRYETQAAVDAGIRVRVEIMNRPSAGPAIAAR